jgi:hypothetical protein
MRIRLVVATICVALLAASCSTSKTTKPSAPSTTATTSPSGPSTTEPATTTSTSAPPTVVTPPPTTTISKQALEAEIRAAVQRTNALYRECVHDPATCNPESFAADPYLSYIRTYLADKFVALGRRVESNPSDPTYSTVTSIDIAADHQSAEYDVCTWDTGITVQALPDSEPVILDALKGTSRRHEKVQLVDERWVLVESLQSETTIIGRNECGARP